MLNSVSWEADDAGDGRMCPDGVLEALLNHPVDRNAGERMRE
jgi:hypothetical protein